MRSFFLREILSCILESMAKRKTIWVGVGVFLAGGCLLGVWMIWKDIYRLKDRTWDFSRQEERVQNTDIQSKVEVMAGVETEQNQEETILPQVKQEEEKSVLQNEKTPVSSPNAEEKNVTIQTKQKSGGVNIEKKFVNFGFGKSARKAQDIDTVVLHSSFNNQGGDQYSVEKVIDIWERYEVAPHFVIDRRGNIVQLVLEHDIAYHAGVSQMKDGRKNVNDFSLGVEILNAEDDTYTAAQYTAVNNLVAHLKKTYPIKYVVGHDAIAPGRKTDPWNFDWKKLE